MTDTDKTAENETAKADRGVRLTERSAKEIGRVFTEQSFEPTSTWLRVGAKGGGCSGLTYILDFDKEGPTEFDLEFESHGVKLIIDKKSEFFVGGMTIDFNDGLLNRGFVFENPQATGSCGCGSSFSA